MRKTSHNKNHYESHKTHKKANKLLIKYVNTESVNSQNIGSTILFMEIMLQWYSIHCVRLKQSTQMKYENLIATHINPDFRNLSMSDITIEQINTYLKYKLTNGRLDGTGALSATYVREIAFIIISALNYGAKEGYHTLAVHDIIKPAIYKHTMSILSRENQIRLESYLHDNPSPTGIGLLISLYAGLRIGEICALQWEDIDLDSELIYVKHTISRVKDKTGENKTRLIVDNPKTKSSLRVIPLHPLLTSILTTYRKSAKSKYIVSYKESFVSPRTFEARFNKILNINNIKKINYHALRHTFATRCIEAGVDIKSLSEILGHTNTSITMNIYVHSSLEMKKNQIEKLMALY